MRRRSLRAALPLALASPSPGAAGRRDRTSQVTRPPGTPADQVKTDGFEDLGPVTLTVISSEGSGGPRDALKALSKSFEEKYPNVTVKISFRDFAALDQAGQARRVQRQPAGRVRRQPGLPARRRAREGGPDPPAHRVRQGVRLGRVLHAGDAAAVRVDRRRPDVRRGDPVGRRPDRPVRRRVRQQEEAGGGRRRPRVAEDVRRLRRRARQAARLAAGRRAGDRARQQGPVRRAPSLGRDPGRLHAGAGRARLDLPEGRRDVRHRGQPARRSRSSRSGRTRATSASPTSTTRATTRTPAIAFGKGEGALDDRRQLERRDREGRARRRRRRSSTCRPARAATRSRSARRASRCTSRPRRSSRTSRRRTSTGSPGRDAGAGAGRHPAGAGGDRRRPPSRATRSARTSRPAGTSSSRTAA